MMAQARPAPSEAHASTPLAKRAAWNSIFSTVQFVHAAVATAVVTPILVRQLGPSLYGIFALTTVLISMLSALDFGVGTSLVKFLSEHIAKRETAVVDRLIGSSLVFYGAVGAAGAVTSWVVALVGPEHIFNIPPADVDVAKLAFAVAGFSFLFSMVGKVFRSVPLAVQRYEFPLAINVALNTASAVATIVLVYSGFGLGAVVTVVAAVEAARATASAVVARRLLSRSVMTPSFDRATFARLARFSGYLFLASVGAIVLFEFDRLLIGALAGVKTVSYYVVPGAVAAQIYIAVTSLASITIAASSDLVARGDVERLHQLYVRSTRAVVPFILSLSIPVFILADQGLRYWISADFADHSTDVLRLLVLTYAILALTIVPWNIVVGVGRPRLPATFNALLAVLNVALVIVLVPLFGIVGAASAYLVSSVPALGLIWYVERRVLTRSPSAWPAMSKRLAIPVAAQIAACVAARPLINDVGTLFLAFVVTVPILGAVFHFGRFSDVEDRALVRSLIRRNR
jgi:O-antigen/teichoic acid export membrane protein